MALEGQQAVGLVYDLLKADQGAGGVNTLVAGRIYRDLAPQDASLPAVVVSLVSHVDVNTVGGDRVFANTQIDVRVVGTGTAYQNAVAARADAVLQNAAGARNGTAVVELVRAAVRAFVEDDAGRLYSHIVQTYSTPAYAAA
jgi:hypothetical protein